ncbi:MAG: type I restriction endonuclease subunit R [Cyanobacteriota bacterium]|nr:type I restriction endonuclease subunit R [Cyanobacteriota bacterium]
MTQTVGITKAITNLDRACDVFNLSLATDPDFFWEWMREIPELTDIERGTLDRLRNRYRYYQAGGAITESTFNLIIVSPLLELLGLYDPPYFVRGEKYIKIEIEDGDRILEGLIDILVVRQQLWLVVVETKRYGFSVMQALPQTLAYMMGNSEREVGYGFITTGEDYLFVKLDRQQHQYDISDKFTLSTRRGNQLYSVVGILKQFVGRG